ncbi:MAG TPA: thermonuclease family protein, partial [Candidatus Cloacimonadota bacterium]|nr:thermonuclease family protein [Candidatus Cloacimonadota bacterium]
MFQIIRQHISLYQSSQIALQRTFLLILPILLLGCTPRDEKARTGFQSRPRSQEQTAQAELKSERGYKVIRVVDGDTFIIDMDGLETRIRLIGVDTPESVHPNKDVEAFGLEASAFLKQLLAG